MFKLMFVGKMRRAMLAAAVISCFAGVAPSSSRNVIRCGEHAVSPDTAACDTVPVRIARRGIIIVGRDSSLRAMEPFGGTTAGGVGYAGVVNSYKSAFGDSVAVYCMPIPTAVEFYCPEKAKDKTRNERPVMDAIFNGLAADVIPVDVYGVLKAHADEPIYSRTDHHWAPLGAYYAAYEFASAAHVPFMGLSGYDRKVVKNYVGSMYTFSKDPSVKAAPEDFVYYVPTDVDYEATFTNYRVGCNRKVVSVGKPEKRDFFIKYPDGSSGAYCTFMGGDLRTVKVETAVRNGRRLAILKDSYGNAVPGYLFHSFEEIHVIDFRYFTENIKKYVKDNRITDVLFVNNMAHACLSSTHAAYSRLLEK